MENTLNLDDIKHLIFDVAACETQDIIDCAEYPEELPELDRVLISKKAIKMHKEKKTRLSVDMFTELGVDENTKDVNKLLDAFDMMAHEISFFMPIIRSELEDQETFII